MAMPFVDMGNLRISTKLNATNDSVAGGNVAGGTGSPLYQGLLGKRVWLDNASALELSYTTTGTLYAGIYQYVQVISTGGAGVRGQIAFWSIGAASATAILSSGSQYIVTATGSATVGDGLWAGIFLSAVTAGNYGWIQLLGLASVLFRAAVTNTTAGNLAVVTTTSNVADAIADGTTVTGSLAKCTLGTCLEAPANNTVSKVFLRNPIFF